MSKTEGYLEQFAKAGFQISISYIEKDYQYRCYIIKGVFEVQSDSETLAEAVENAMEMLLNISTGEAEASKGADDQ